MTARWRSSLAIAGANAFVVVVFVALVVALRSRSWDGLEAVVIPVLLAGAVALETWVLVLSIALAGNRRRARSAFVLTFAAATVLAGVATVDVVRRAFIEDSAPGRHVVLPALLLGLASSAAFLATAARHDQRSRD